MEVSRSKEIIGDQEVETVINMVCKSCKRIQARCKCSSPAFEAVTSVYKRPLIKPGDQPAQPKDALSPEESKRRFEEKMAAKNAKKAEQEEIIRVANMDDEDLAKESEEKSKNSELAKWEAERAREAAANVDEIRSLKKSLQAEGKNALEIKTAVKDLTEKQKKRGRPANNAVLNPVKDPVTGEFKSAEETE